jgi:predicted hydrolase (HD superfamily)
LADERSCSQRSRKRNSYQQEKIFAKGGRPEEIEKCTNAGLELDEFISICIKAMQGIAADLGL